MSSSCGYDLAAPDYDQKEKYLSSFEKGQLQPLFANLGGKKVLDVGAGTGRLVGELIKRGAKVTALDVSTEMLLVLKKKFQIEAVVGDAEALPFPEGTFDWVVATFLIVHLKNPRHFFDQAYRVLKPGGKLLVTNINQKEPPEVKTKEGNIKIESYYHRPQRVREILEELAFGIEEEIFIEEGEEWVNQIIVARK